MRPVHAPPPPNAGVTTSLTLDNRELSGADADANEITRNTAGDIHGGKDRPAIRVGRRGKRRVGGVSGNAASQHATQRALLERNPRGQTRHPLFKWALQQSPDAEWKRSLLEKIIANPRHPLMEWALSEFPQVAGNASAIALVKRVLASPKYGEPIKKHARTLQDLLLENPYLTLVVQPSEPDALGRKAISITVMNASEDQIELQAENPFELLQVAVTDPDGRELPRIESAPRKLTEEGPIRLQPREVCIFPDIHWWDFADTRNVPPNTGLYLTVTVQTPGLWKQPAKTGRIAIPARPQCLCCPRLSADKGVR